MGNIVSPCFQLKYSSSSSSSSSSSTKLIFWEGTTRTLTGRKIAGEIMFEFPDYMVCHADSFFIGKPIPALAIDDNIVPGQTYFVLPIDLFSSTLLSASSLATLNSSSPKPSQVNFGECTPFEYIKGDNGRVSIKVVPEFITRLIKARNDFKAAGNNGLSMSLENNNISPTNPSFLCSTPELQKHYNQLVGSKETVWSPKLETISEYKIRFSPCRFIGLEWKLKETGRAS